MRIEKFKYVLNFDKMVEQDKKTRRGGAPGDVVPLGKRKEPEPETRSILRKSKPEPQRARQRIYGPKTQIFNMDQEPIRVY